MNPLKTIYLKSWTIVLCVRAIEFRVKHGCVDGSGSFEVAVRTDAAKFTNMIMARFIVTSEIWSEEVRRLWNWKMKPRTVASCQPCCY